MQNQLVCWDAFDCDRWLKDLKKGDTLYIPAIAHVTAVEVVVGTRNATLDPSTTGVTMTIDQWYQAPIDIDEMTARQTHTDLPARVQTECAYAIAKRMDTTLATRFSSLGGYSTSAYGTDGQTLSDDILLYLKQTLDEADVPMDGKRVLVLDPSALVDMLKIDKLVSADYQNQKGAIANGVIGNSVYGCQVRVTNNLTAASTGSYGVMAHKNALAGCVQLNPVKKFEEPWYHSVRYEADALYGTCEERNAFGIPFFTRHA